MLDSKTRVPEGICGCIRLTTEISNPIYPASYPVENLSLCPDARTFSLIAHSFTVDRPAFINRLRFMSSFPHRLVISAPLSQLKSPYAHSNINPNRILQSLIAVLAFSFRTASHSL